MFGGKKTLRNNKSFSLFQRAMAECVIHIAAVRFLQFFVQHFRPTWHPELRGLAWFQSRHARWPSWVLQVDFYKAPRCHKCTSNLVRISATCSFPFIGCDDSTHTFTFL